MGAGIGFVGMEEVENCCTGHFGSLVGHSEIGVEAHSETAADHFGTDLVFHSGKEAVRSGMAEGHCGMEEVRSGIEEAAHSETEVGSRAHLAGGIVEAAQTLGFEVVQNSAAAEEMAIAVVERGVIADRTVEERRNRTNSGVGLQMAFAAVAAKDNLASQPNRNVLVQAERVTSSDDSHSYQDSGPSLDSGCLARFHWAYCLHC